MSAPIFEQLKTERGFDPLEGRTFPKYKAKYDPAHDLWALMKGEWVGENFFVYQPCGYYPSEHTATMAAWFKNTFGGKQA